MSCVALLVSFCEKHGPQTVLTTQAYAGYDDKPASLFDRMETLGFGINPCTATDADLAAPADTGGPAVTVAGGVKPGGVDSGNGTRRSAAGSESGAGAPAAEPGAASVAGATPLLRPTRPPHLSSYSSTTATTPASAPAPPLCRECRWPGFGTPVVSFDPQTGTVYRSTQVPQRAELCSLVRQVCIRALSCEVSPGKERQVSEISRIIPSCDQESARVEDTAGLLRPPLKRVEGSKWGRTTPLVTTLRRRAETKQPISETSRCGSVLPLAFC